MNIVCPSKECGKEHALFYFVDKSGKRKVCYFCKRILKQRKTGIIRDDGTEVVEIYFGSGQLECEQQADNLDIPEQWSKAWRDKKQGEKQNQFRLMNK